MITGKKKSVIRRWETQVGIGVAVACFSVLGVFLGLKIGGSDKPSAPTAIKKAERPSWPKRSSRTREASRSKAVIHVGKEAAGLPDFGEPAHQGLDRQPGSYLSEGEGRAVEAKGASVRRRYSDETVERVLEEASRARYLTDRAADEAALEEPPTIEPSSGDMLAGGGFVGVRVAETAPEGAMTADAARPDVAPGYPKSHTVGPNDTLMGIAQQYYGTVSKWQLIYEANNMSNRNVVVVGQKLVIPAPGSGVVAQKQEQTQTQTNKQVQEPVVKKASFTRAGSPGIAYRVQSGDTLKKLASRYYNDESQWKRIYDANKGSISSDNTLKTGEVLIIP
ncbi:MAG: LysM peptidoglycan-binding domain-containing protein [Planctomycetota bacterium]|jgi:nucleoid-associated protein YgaU